ncbi:MAG: hypothetical protein HMLKMBBP_03968 [Planctomycetes bacterium]|nr:hypothetical protein [Planctomycetota bacterium]
MSAAGPRGGADAPQPILFEELSSASGGPYDFGSPVSDTEKATCAFFDADGDGWEDLLSLTGTNLPDIFLLNRPDPAGGRRFEAPPPGHGFDAGAPYERDGSCLAVADVDNDGDEDLFMGAGWNPNIPAGRGGKMLLLNDGAGRFTDAAPALGIVDADNSCMAAAFFDMDMDGDLDLLACNTRFPMAGKDGDGFTHLWRNTLAETGTFALVEETELRGVVEEGMAIWAVQAFDKDLDGDEDFVITHDIYGKCQLFRNDGSGFFTDVMKQSGTGVGDDADPSTFGDDSHASMGTAVGDPDHDGDLDLYVTNTNRNPFYVNDGTGKFTELGETRGARAGDVTWGANFCDFDLDGWEDLYVSSGDIWDRSRPEVIDFLYRNQGGGWFTDVREGSGIRHDPPLHRTNGTAVADWDADGRPDLLVSRVERAGAGPYLYRNVSPTYERRWTSILLKANGTTTNRSAIGAIVRVTPLDAAGAPIPGLAQMQQVFSAESRGSRSSLRRHFGLGPDARAVDVTVTWPRAGTVEERTQVFRSLPVDSRITIHEDPQHDTWAIAGEALQVLPDGAETVFAVQGAGVPDALVRVVMDSAPEWVAEAGYSDGWRLRATAPRVDAPAEFAVSLRTEPQGTLSPEASQALTLRVVPAPRAETARRRGSPSRVRISGDHLDLPGLDVACGTHPCRVKKARVRTSSGGAPVTTLDVVVPRAALRAAPKGARRELTVTDPATGFSTVVHY